MHCSHDNGLAGKLALGLLILAIGIAITILAGRAITENPDPRARHTTELLGT